MIALGREFDVPAVLYGAHEGYAAASRIAKARIPVIVSAKWPEKPKDADPDADELLETLELRDRAPRTPAALAEQKVPFAFSSDGLATPGEFLTNVRKAIKAGLPADAALRALTIDAARIYGVQDRLGSLEAGKIANLIVVQGDLLGEKSTVKQVFVDGRRFEVPADAGAVRHPATGVVRAPGRVKETVDDSPLHADRRPGGGQPDGSRDGVRAGRRPRDRHPQCDGPDGHQGND